MAKSSKKRTRYLPGRALCVVAMIAAALGLITVKSVVPAQAAAYCHATMSGTFVPVEGWASTWDLNRTNQELTGMRGVGINRIILQNSVDLGVQKAWYPQSQYPQGTNVIANLVQGTTSRHMSLILGLADSGYSDWAAHQGDPTWLTNRLLVDEHIADQLYASYGASISGWYIPDEVDDYALYYHSGTITSYFSRLTAYLHTHDGKKMVMVAPFYQNFETPTTFATGLRKVMGTVDVVNVQDGASEGPGRSSAQITTLFTAVSKALAGGPALWDDPDLYGANGGPMAPSSLQANLNAVCGLTSFITGFSYPSQLDPLNGESAQYDAYQSYRR